MIPTLSDLSPEQLAKHHANYGLYNDFPPNWREVTPADIATCSLGRTYQPELIEHRQMGHLTAGSKPLLDATLYFFHDGSGHAIHYDYHGRTVRWYMFHLCQHSYTEISRPPTPRAGIHTNRCKKCGYTYSYDTSD